MTKEERIFMANILDEGSHISIQLAGSMWRVLVIIGRKDTGFLKRLQQIVGNKGSFPSPQQLKWTSLSAVRLLREIYPHLKEKQKHAELIFEFQRLLDPKNVTSRRSLGAKLISRENMDRRHALMGELRMLNGKNERTIRIGEKYKADQGMDQSDPQEIAKAVMRRVAPLSKKGVVVLMMEKLVSEGEKEGVPKEKVEKWRQIAEAVDNLA